MSHGGICICFLSGEADMKTQESVADSSGYYIPSNP